MLSSMCSAPVANGKCFPTTSLLIKQLITTFTHWQRKGIWEEIHDTLRRQLRRQMGREDDSSLAIADSQSVKTTEKRGWSVVLTVVKKLRGVSAISL